MFASESLHDHEVAGYSVRRSRFTLAAVSSGYVLRFFFAVPGPADANQRVLPLVRFILLQGIALASFAPLL